MNTLHIKALLRKWYKKQKLSIPRRFLLNTRKGSAYREMIARFQASSGLSPSGTMNRATYLKLVQKTGPRYKILKSYHAIHFGKWRRVGSIRYTVLHDMEFAGDTAAEALGRMSESASYPASPHFGIDDDSIQQYLALSRIGWHCTSFNTQTVGIEQAGYASYTERQWKSHIEMLKRTAFVLALISKKTGEPLVYRDAAYLRKFPYPKKGAGGVTTHLAHTLASVPGDHTDPGAHYHMSYVLTLAKKYRMEM